MQIASVSGTFLKFIEPLLSELDYPDPESKEFDHAIKTGWTIWNAVIKNDVEGDPSFLLLVKSAVPAPISILTDELIKRKQTHFAADEYLIGVCEVRTKTDGAVTLYADARQPAAAMRV